MILKGSQRGGALKLAAHLMNMVENDHVEVHELRGFSCEDLHDALQEADAIAKGTKCQQFLFSLSFNPPETERVSVRDFEAAIEKAEAKLGLTGQARAIVFHEKEGRRHAHVVWPWIDLEKMTAIHLSFYKTRLNDVSKELFLEHGWRLPDGYRDRTDRNPLNFTLDQWQQAKRTGQDPKALKLLFQKCWSVSDNQASFARALEEQGFVLARGTRGHVAVDFRGEVYAVSRQTGQKAKAVWEKLGDAKDLPSVDQVKEMIASRMTDKLQRFIRDAEQERMIAAQLSERRALQQYLRTARRETQQQSEDLRRDVAFYLGMRKRIPGEDETNLTSHRKSRKASRSQPTPQR